MKDFKDFKNLLKTVFWLACAFGIYKLSSLIFQLSSKENWRFWQSIYWLIIFVVGLIFFYLDKKLRTKKEKKIISEKTINIEDKKINTKTISYFKTKAWYGVFKMLYLFFAIISYITASYYVLLLIKYFSNGEINLFLCFLLSLFIYSWAFVITQIPKWVVYYIVLGTAKPKD
ncbi:MAG: hypothetical protein V1667_03730 [bacterium]